MYVFVGVSSLPTGLTRNAYSQLLSSAGALVRQSPAEIAAAFECKATGKHANEIVGSLLNIPSASSEFTKHCTD